MALTIVLSSPARPVSTTILCGPLVIRTTEERASKIRPSSSLSIDPGLRR